MTEPPQPTLAHRRPTSEHLVAIARRFLGPQASLSIEELVAGHINLSWRVDVEGGRSFLLQRINHHVFRDPVTLMRNVARVTDHLRARLAERGATGIERRCLRLVETLDGSDHHVDDDGWLYRLYRFIEGAATYVKADDPRRVGAAAHAFGCFLADLAGLDPAEVVPSIPRFHDIAYRFEQLERAVRGDPLSRALGCRAEIEGFLEHRALLDRVDHRELPQRVVHADAKLTNVLFDAITGEVLCVIDLDTVMPGLACHDFGELVRSMSHRFDEDERRAERVRCDPELLDAICRGFVAGAAPLLEAGEVASLVDGALLMTVENGVRFLADHLEGDRYFRVGRPDHNLDRARTQLALLRSLIEQEERVRTAVDRAWRSVHAAGC